MNNNNEKEQLVNEIESLRQTLLSLHQQIHELNEEILIQNCGLYMPEYTYSTSTEYKKKLDDIREQEKMLILNDRAINTMPQLLSSYSWELKKVSIVGFDTYITDRAMLKNLSQSYFDKLVLNQKKFLLENFNLECDRIISKVKYNNCTSLCTKIDKIYSKLNGAAINGIYISSEYADLKQEELKLAYEYECKKKEEKDLLREQRDIQRENARVQKELDEERERIEKEKIHYENQKLRLLSQLSTETNEEKANLLSNKIEFVNSELDELEKALQEVDYRQANQRAGYVYVISNIGAFGENVYKIGMTRRLEPQDRIDELGGASVPFRFDIHALIFSEDAPKLESALHNAFSDKRVNMINGRKEFFRVSLEEIEQVIKENYDKTTEFIYTPLAEQYRETLKIQENRKTNG